VTDDFWQREEPLTPVRERCGGTAMLSETDTIVIKAPGGTKARWVHDAQRHWLKLSDWIIRSVDLPTSKMAQTSCQRCGSVLLVADGPTHWQCGRRGLAS
jgi:ribosomal protein S27AE